MTTHTVILAPGIAEKMAQVIEKQNMLYANFSAPILLEQLREFIDIGPKVELRLTGPDFRLTPEALVNLGWEAGMLAWQAWRPSKP